MREIKVFALVFLGLLIAAGIPFVEDVKADVETSVTYYFNDYIPPGFTNFPQYMCDGNNYTFGETAPGGIETETLNRTSCPGTSYGTITKIEARIRGLYIGTGSRHTIYFSINSGIGHSYILSTLSTWSSYFDVSSDFGGLSNGWLGVRDCYAEVYTFFTSAGVSILCARLEIRITYIKPSSVLNIPLSSVYPVNNSYTHPLVTLSWNCTTGSMFNYTLYKKIGAGSFWLDDTKTGLPSGTNTYYKRWFNATSLNTLYTWKVCLKNYTINNWKNYTFYFYINDTTVHLSDTKTNVAGTLTSLRNNTGFYITSIHNSSITPKDKSINSTLTHVYYWVTNTWVDYANSTGNISACDSTNLTLYEDIVNATGTHQSYYDPLLGWYAWANYTGNSSAPGPGAGNYSIRLNFTGLQGFITWYGDYTGNTTNISFYATANRSVNGSVHVDEDAYFLSGMLSFDPSVMILSLFFGFFYIGYESKKRSGGFFMLFAGFLLIALGILVYGMLGYAAVLVIPFALFIMLLGGKKAFYGPETEESQSDRPTK